MSLPVLILDANAFICYSDLNELSNKFTLVTAPSITEELKDPSARAKIL